MPLDDLEREKLNQMILSKMQDTSNFDEAMQAENQSNLLSNMGEATEGIFKARSMALGGQGVDTPFYKNLRDQAGQRTQTEAEKTSQGLKTLLFQKNNLDEKAKAAQATEQQDYQRGQDATKNLFETQKIDLMRNRGNSSDSPFEIRSDEFGRLVKVDKNTGRAERLNVGQNGAQNSGNTSSQMEADVNQPPSPTPGETREQYRYRMRKFEKENSDVKGDLSRSVNVGGEEFLTRTPDDAKILKESATTKEGFDRKLSELINLRKEFGVEYADRNAVSRAKQLSKDLLLAYKNMQKLGVLSQSDEAIINAILPSDPLGQDFAMGQDPILNNLQKFKEDSDADFQSNLKNRIYKSTGQKQEMQFEKGESSQGQKMPAQQQPQQLSDEDRQALDWAKSNQNDPRAKAIIESFSN